MPVLDGQILRPVKEHFPLSLSMTCRNCEATFEAQRACPACTSDAIQSTESYCRGRGDQQQRDAFISAACGE